MVTNIYCFGMFRLTILNVHFLKTWVRINSFLGLREIIKSEKLIFVYISKFYSRYLLLAKIYCYTVVRTTQLLHDVCKVVVITCTLMCRHQM